jgi:hypothetical protein
LADCGEESSREEAKASSQEGLDVLRREEEEEQKNRRTLWKSGGARSRWR